VYIPPVRILEKYYGAPKLDSPPHSPSAPPPARIPERSDAGASVQPANLSQVGFGTPVKSLPSAQSTPLYRVHEGGETMYEIARRTLGNGARWTEISRLNPRFDPKEVIPAGSTLQLPKDAHVSPQDVP
jgi:nucleoid-associated protein YgaU